MTQSDAIATLKLIQTLWPNTVLPVEVIPAFREKLQSLPLGLDQVTASLNELRLSHRFQTVQPADVLVRLKAIAYPSSGSVGVPTLSDQRPTLSRGEIDAKRARVKEWAGFTDWQIVAEWFGGVKIKHWRGSWEYWTNALALDLRVYGCPANMIAGVIDDTRTHHIDAVLAGMDTRGRGEEGEQG